MTADTSPLVTSSGDSVSESSESEASTDGSATDGSDDVITSPKLHNNIPSNGYVQLLTFALSNTIAT